MKAASSSAYRPGNLGGRARSATIVVRGTCPVLFGLLLGLAACGDSSTEAPSITPPRVAPVAFVTPAAVIRHDPTAFTQGLAFHDGYFYESTGGRGDSTLRRVDPRTGEILRRIEIPAPYFAEGVTVLGDRIYQLTWQENTGFVYDLESLERLGTFSYPGEGWGLTTDGTHLIRSNGSNRLHFFDPETFSVQRILDVRDSIYPVHMLNELEWVEGEIWANIWRRDEIARIDPESGRVVGWLDLEALVPPVRFSNREAVANGIAFDDGNWKVYVTGKLWPEIYEIELPVGLRAPVERGPR